MRTKWIEQNGKALTIKVIRFKQKLPGIIQKALKQSLQHVNFLKFFRGSMPRIPLEPFLFRNQLQISSALQKLRLKKKCRISGPSPL